MLLIPEIWKISKSRIFVHGTRNRAACWLLKSVSSLKKTLRWVLRGQSPLQGNTVYQNNLKHILEREQAILNTTVFVWFVGNILCSLRRCTWRRTMAGAEEPPGVLPGQRRRRKRKQQPETLVAVCSQARCSVRAVSYMNAL